MIAHVWFFYAIAAAICWGLTYTISGRLLGQGVPMTFILLLESMFVMPLFLLLGLKTGDLKTGISMIMADKCMWLMFGFSIAAIIAARLMIFHSFTLKNATTASLVEISYPFFILLFSWLLFREMHLNWASAAGGLLIFSGIALIYLKG